MVQVTGKKPYAARLDVNKLESFLREQGMSEHDINMLQVRFVHEIPLFSLSYEAVGKYLISAHTILIATGEYKRKNYYTKKSQQEILVEFNETLLHEIKHALDRKAMKLLNTILKI